MKPFAMVQDDHVLVKGRHIQWLGANGKLIDATIAHITAYASPITLLNHDTCRRGEIYIEQIKFYGEVDDSKLEKIKTPQTHPDHHTVGHYFGGHSYKTQSTQVYFCDSYDPEIGYWLTNVNDPEDRKNVSERAIGRTYHMAEDKGDYYWITQWGVRFHRQGEVTMTTYIPDPQHAPFTVDPDQLARLDALIKKALPHAKITTGCKYARWAEVDGTDTTSLSLFREGRAWPDQVFHGVIFGQTKTIYMWLPFFD